MMSSMAMEDTQGALGFDLPFVAWHSRGMRFLIMGAGAVGLAFGGFLRRAGHAVDLVGRTQHQDARASDGPH
jgi:hypothetical protein